MPPTPLRKSIPKERFAATFSAYKTQTYHDPSSRGPGSHTIKTIAWNPTGHLIATGSVDKILRIWNPEKSQVKNSTELRGHTGTIERVAWNPMKEAELASVSGDGTCKIWDVRSKGCVETIQLGGEGLTLCWAADGSAMLVGRKDDTLIPITVSNLSSIPANEPPTPTVSVPTSAFNALTFIPQKEQTNQTLFPPTSPSSILLTTGTGHIKFSTYPSLTPLHSLSAHTSACTCVALSPSGRYLASGGSDALICLWDTTDWVCRRTLAKMAGPVKSLGFSWDGAYVVGGSDEGNGLEIAHTETGEYVHTVVTSAPAMCVAWHPSRYWLAYSGDTAGLKIVADIG